MSGHEELCVPGLYASLLVRAAESLMALMGSRFNSHAAYFHLVIRTRIS